MSYLVNLDVRGRRVIVAGAGPVAARKVRALVEGGARVTVIAPEVGGEIETLARDGTIRIERRAYARGDARGAFVVVSATNSDEVNRLVAEDAHAAGALAHVVDRPALGDFTMPALLRRGLLTIGIVTDGQCPAYARLLRDRLEGQLGPEFGEAVEHLAAMRQRMRADGRSNEEIRSAVEAAVAGGIVEAIAGGDLARVERLIDARPGRPA